MAEPQVADTKPKVLSLEPGSYWWCACGLSKNQPSCDGSHKVTDLKPVNFSLAERKQVALCMCKQTGSKPYCDGTHKHLG